MKLKVLGTQSPIAVPGHNCPGFFIEHNGNKLLLDFGSGCHSLLKYPNDLQNLSAFISHFHWDHYNDIFNLQYAAFVLHNQKRLERPIDIYMPQTPLDKAKIITGESLSYAKYHSIDEKTSLSIGDINISFCKTDHGVETYAIKVMCSNKCIVYTSDTSYSAKDKLVNFAKDADLLICESSLLKEHGFPEINSHLTAEQAGIIAKEANVKGLALTHFWFEEDVQKYVSEAKTIFKNVVALREGQIIDIPVISKEEKCKV